MQLAVLGLNHKTAPIEVREQFALDATQVHQARPRFTVWPSWMRRCF